MDFDADLLKELQAEFLKEAKDLLAETEEALLRIQPGRGNTEDIALIFRLVHSVKGAAASVGLEDIGKFCHKFEDCISLLRVNEDILNDAMVMLYLKSIDALKTRLEHLANNAMGTSWDTLSIEADLIKIIEQNEGKVASADEKPAAPNALAEQTEIPAVVTATETKSEAPAQTKPAVAGTPTVQTKNPEKQSSTIKMDTEKLN